VIGDTCFDKGLVEGSYFGTAEVAMGELRYGEQAGCVTVDLRN
jgi:hypothetical protein